MSEYTPIETVKHSSVVRDGHGEVSLHGGKIGKWR